MFYNAQSINKHNKLFTTTNKWNIKKIHHIKSNTIIYNQSKRMNQEYPWEVNRLQTKHHKYPIKTDNSRSWNSLIDMSEDDNSTC